MQNDPQRTGHGEVHRLMTNLLDETEYPARELIALDHERWEEELVFDEQQAHQDPRRAGKPAHLRSETPDGVRQQTGSSRFKEHHDRHTVRSDPATA